MMTDILFLDELKGNFTKAGNCSLYSLYLMPHLERNLRIETSVEDPFSSGSRFAVLFTQPLMVNSSVHSLLVVI